MSSSRLLLQVTFDCREQAGLCEAGSQCAYGEVSSALVGGQMIKAALCVPFGAVKTREFQVHVTHRLV